MNAVLHRYLSFFIVVLTDTVAVLVVAMTALYVVTAVAVAEVDFVFVMATATTAVVATVHWVNLTLHNSEVDVVYGKWLLILMLRMLLMLIKSLLPLLLREIKQFFL